jgi:membrane protease YdiL (CAAX protease family)
MPQLPQDVLDRWPTALAGVLLYLGVVCAAWAVGRRLLPPPRQRAVPWTGFEICAALFLVYVLWVPLVAQVLLSTGLGEWLYGRDLIEAARSSADKSALMRISLLAGTLAFPFQVLTIIALLRLGSGTQPYQLGLTTSRLGRNVLLGVLGALILTPPVLALNILVTGLLGQLSGGKGITEHPLTQLSRSLPSGEFVLIVLSAVVAAPVLEELIFRGLLLRSLARFRWGGSVAMGLALLWAGWFSALQLPDARGLGWAARLQALGPVLFVLAMMPAFAWVSRDRRSPFGSALYGTSLLFAVSHSFAWPSPVALFVLALGLGWLAQRTQSLVGPIGLHGLFNSVACVLLLIERCHGS